MRILAFWKAKWRPSAHFKTPKHIPVRTDLNMFM